MTFFRFLVLLLAITSSIKAQVLTTDIPRNSRNIFPFSAEITGNDIYISTYMRGQLDSLSYLLIYDNVSLQLKDSISSAHTGRSHVHFRDQFKFNNKHYVIATPNDSGKYGLSVHQIQGNSLVDSASVGLDTCLRPFIGKIEPIISISSGTIRCIEFIYYLEYLFYFTIMVLLSTPVKIIN